jgi:hypothetical protein
MGATFSRVKTWIAEKLTFADLNAEINNILNNFTPAGMDDYSASVAEMQTQTDPGEVGSESQATNLSGEIERLRFAINEIKGTTQWYESANTNLGDLLNSIGGGLPANRIVSCATSSLSSQPQFLDPNGSADTATVLATTTPLVYTIENTQYTISADIAISNLVSAPTSNNTALVDNTNYADEASTKYVGEYGTTLAYDTVGSEITNLNGKIAAFKIVTGVPATEYFIAQVDNTNSKLRDIKRGYFYDSSQNPIPRIVLADNDVITLMSLAWVYTTTAGGVALSYTNPVVSPAEPTSPAANDYWFDLVNLKWKKFDSATFVDAGATLVGFLVIDENDICVASRSFDTFQDRSGVNTVELVYKSASTIESAHRLSTLKVYGASIRIDNDYLVWDMASDLESGVSEGASTVYYAYVTEAGASVISDIAPYDRRGDLGGFYHPHETWRYVGKIDNDGSSDFIETSLVNAPENQVERLRVYNSSTTWLMTPGIVSLQMEVIGGGGGGGGTAGTNAGEGSEGAAGGGGGYSIRTVSNKTQLLDAHIAVTVGSGGSGGAAGSNSGSAGGTSSFGTMCQSTGGGGGAGGSNTASENKTAGGAGGSGSLGNLNLIGGSGTNGRVLGGHPSLGGLGGSSRYGESKRAAAAGAGLTGTSHGGGGSGGALEASSSQVAGGNGASGLVLVTEFYK